MKATLSTLTFLDNKKGILLYFLILPIINVLVLVGFSYTYNNDISYDIALASIVLSGGVMTISCINSSFVYDIRKKIDLELISTNPYSLYYWRCKVLVALSCSLALITVNTFLIYFVSGGEANIKTVLFTTPLILFYSTVFGMFASFLSWNMKNPYFASNIITTYGNIFSGVIVLYSLYPPVLKLFTYLFPYAHTLGLFHSLNSFWLYDMLYTLIIALLTIIIYKRQIKNVTVNNSLSIV